jgi:hypothetical protein
MFCDRERLRLLIHDRRPSESRPLHQTTATRNAGRDTAAGGVCGARIRTIPAETTQAGSVPGCRPTTSGNSITTAITAPLPLVDYRALAVDAAKRTAFISQVLISSGLRGRVELRGQPTNAPQRHRKGPE